MPPPGSWQPCVTTGFLSAGGTGGSGGEAGELNGRPFRKREGTRREAYLGEDLAFMQPLPSTPYEPAAWSPELRVDQDYLVSDGQNKYSVAFDLIGEKVVLRLTRQTVEVFYRGTRAAMHRRASTVQRDPIVKMEHMPPEHRRYMNYNMEDFTLWGSSVGEHTAAVVRYFLTSGKASEQGYKSCASLTKLAERYGAKRLESACERLLAFTAAPSIRALNTILKNGQDKLPGATAQEGHRNDRQHGITRGAAYFHKGGVSK